MDELDRKIKDWAAHVPGVSGQPRESFLQRIIGALQARDRVSVQARLAAYRRQLLWTRVALATCALLLVAVLPLRAPGWHSGAGGRDQLTLSSNELQELGTVAEAVSSMFPEGVAWIGRVGDTLDIHPGTPSAIGGGGQRLLITFQVVQRDAHGKETVMRRDIIVRDGEAVEWNDGQKIALWTHQVSEDHVSIELDNLFQNAELAIRVRDRFLQAFGEQKLIARATSQERLYEVYQTAYRL